MTNDEKADELIWAWIEANHLEETNWGLNALTKLRLDLEMSLRIAAFDNEQEFETDYAAKADEIVSKWGMDNPGLVSKEALADLRQRIETALETSNSEL